MSGIEHVAKGSEVRPWPLFLGLLTASNRAWAQSASALVVFVSKTTFDHDGRPASTHSFDTGPAWENLAIQASLTGYVAHGMEGFDHERARTELDVPEGFAIEAMAAIGVPGDKALLPEKTRKMEAPNGRRRLADTVHEGRFPWR